MTHPHTIPCHTFERVLRPLLPWISLVAASFCAVLVLALIPPLPAQDVVAAAGACVMASDPESTREGADRRSIAGPCEPPH